jgi:DNA polymerase-3 subunit gamma/tau
VRPPVPETARVVESLAAADPPAEAVADRAAPVSEPAAAEAPAVEIPAASSPEPVTVTSAGSPLSLVDVRRLWPDIVEATKQRRRVTWIHLTQQAQVVQVDDSTLTLGFGNAGARDSFDSGGSGEIVRQAAIDVVGHDWRVETIVDPGAQASGQPAPARPPATASAPAPPGGSETGIAEPPTEPEPAPEPVEPPSASARQAIRRTGASDTSDSPPSDADGGARHDDVDAESTGLDGTQLLHEALGAEVIEEIPHQ